MTYEEMKLLRPGALLRVKGGVYDYMFIQGASPFDDMIRVEMIRAKSAVLLSTTRL